MRSKIQVWWDESDGRPLCEVSVRSSGEAELPDSSQGREPAFPTACWAGRQGTSSRQPRNQSDALDKVSATSTDRSSMRVTPFLSQ